jgi:hypothetical protein
MPSSERAAVWLDHLVLVLDAETYAAAAASELLRDEFAAFEQRAITTGDAETWTGTYLYGEHTYLELFAPCRAVGRADSVGLAFSVEESGGAERIANRLRTETGAPVASSVRTVRLGEETIPWFHYVRVEYHNPGRHVSTWVMEYHAAFAAFLAARKGGAPIAGNLTRRDALAARFSSTRLLRDVVGVTLALDDVESDRLRRQLLAFGYVVSQVGDGHIASGPDVRIALVPASGGRRGVMAIELALLRRKSGRTRYELGPRSVLTFHDDLTATWVWSGR